MIMLTRCKQSAFLLAIVMLTSCMATAQIRESGEQAAGRNASVPISHMSPEFLYLAAAQAMESGNPSLAIGFLQAVADKDELAVLPRLQLAELLLQSSRAGEARSHITALLDMQQLTDGQRDRARLLSVRLLVLDNKPAKAISRLQSMLDDTPEAYPLRLMLVRLLTREKRFSDAHRVIRDGLKGQQHPQLYHIDAQIYIRQGKLDKAEQALKTLMQIEPDAAGPVLMFSQLAQRQKKPVKAENLLRHYLARHPDALSVSNTLGRMLVEQGRSQEAVRVYEDIAERTGDNPDVRIALGLLHYQLQSFDKAATNFKKALNQRRDARAMFYLAASLESLGQNEEAGKFYARIRNGDENFTEAQIRLAALDLRADRIEKTINSLRSIIRKQPGLGQAYSLLSAALMRKKAYAQLLEETEPALALREVPAQVLFNRAAAFEGQKQYARAAGQIKKLFTMDPNNIEALNFLGYLYAEQGIRLDEAEKLIRRALDQQPDNGYYLDSLAWVHYKRAEYDKALSVQQKAIIIVPTDPIMREHLGDILWKSGKTDAARLTWEKAVQLGHEEKRRMQQKINKGM